MIKVSIENDKKNIQENIKILEERCEKKKELLEFCRTPVKILKQYSGLLNQLKLADRKRRKKLIKNLQIYKNENKFIDEEVKKIIEINDKTQEIFKLQQEHQYTSDYINETIKIVLGILTDYGFITHKLELTPRGIIGANVQEVHSIVFGDLIDNRKFDDLNARELIYIFSCFANVPIPEDQRSPNILNKKISKKAKYIIEIIQGYYNEIQDIELNYNLNFRTQSSHLAKHHNTYLQMHRIS